MTIIITDDDVKRLLSMTECIDAMRVAFSDFAKQGFVSLPTDATYQEDVKLCRTIYPKVNVNGKDELAFSVQIAMQFDSVKTAAEELLATLDATQKAKAADILPGLALGPGPMRGAFAGDQQNKR